MKSQLKKLIKVLEYFRNHLGFLKFGAQGGDWGSFVTSRIGYLYPELLYGIHLNMLPLRRDPSVIESTTPEEATYLKELKEFRKQETGYQWIQGTKPQTLAYSLTASPTGLAAWIVEKFHSWSDHRGDLNAYLGRDTSLTNIMLYWISGCIGASFWPYYARLNGEWPVPMGH